MDTQSKENAATAPQKEPDHFLRFCCAVTFTDIVALRECDSKEDEKTIILRALVGIVLLLVTAPLWMLLLSSMLEFPLWAAMATGEITSKHAVMSAISLHRFQRGDRVCSTFRM